MGIHYDYKSTRGDKAMKKEAKRKARIEQRRAKRTNNSSSESEEKIMHDIDKPITLEYLTNQDKKQLFLMKSFQKKDYLLKNREEDLKRNLKKRKKSKKEKKKNDCSFRQVD